jgi:hypothetical protein
MPQPKPLRLQSALLTLLPRLFVYPIKRQKPPAMRARKMVIKIKTE